MKTIKNLLLILLSLFYSQVSNAQKGSNEFESLRLDCNISNESSKELIDKLKGNDKNLFDFFKGLYKKNNNNLSSDTSLKKNLDNLKEELEKVMLAIEKGENKAVMLIYRNMQHVGAERNETSTFNADFSSLNTKIFHAKQKDDKFSNYLLATKTFYIILIDLNKEYFQTYKEDADQKLSGTKVKITYRVNRFKQSFADLAGAWKAMSGNPTNGLQLTIIKVEPSRIKDPCDIVLSNKSFKEDQIVTIHERNVATFQIGVTSSKVSVKNISISGTDLIVKPDAAQSTDWKSNAYALLELHLPRDVDNFRPLWKSLFSAQPGKGYNFGDWVYENTISRIGIYGGVKISGDPLSSLYSGFNYAVSKDVAVNFGWAWVNQYANQVTDIGSISSISDALKYAKRSYAQPKFSIGISFSPSAFSTAIGLKNKSADTGSNQ